MPKMKKEEFWRKLTDCLCEECIVVAYCFDESKERHRAISGLDCHEIIKKFYEEETEK
jgi:hypothetical protein